MHERGEETEMGKEAHIKEYEESSGGERKRVKKGSEKKP